MASATSTVTSKRQATCTAILEATSQLIAEKGLDGFTMSEVAQRAEINRALIYHYYQNRDNLVTQAIDHMIERFRPTEALSGPEAAEHSLRMYIEHPEVARFIFQLLLNGRPLMRLGERITVTIDALKRMQQEHAPQSEYDAAFAFIILVLAQLSWAFSREELARLLGLSVEEADERFIACMRRETEAGIAAITGQTR